VISKRLKKHKKITVYVADDKIHFSQSSPPKSNDTESPRMLDKK
jgi:hypothetical protein